VAVLVVVLVPVDQEAALDPAVLAAVLVRVAQVVASGLVVRGLTSHHLARVLRASSIQTGRAATFRQARALLHQAVAGCRLHPLLIRRRL
jgi:hypothetical protein